MDNAVVSELTSRMMVLVRAHYTEGEIGQEKVYEALNALGICVGVILAGAGGDPVLRAFFDDTVENQMKQQRQQRAPRRNLRHLQ